MTESNQGPATPGTAARCEVCGLPPAGVAEFVQVNARPRDSVCWRKQSEVAACNARCVERLKAENASLRSELGAAENRREYFRESAKVAAEKASGWVAENASLLESLRAARAHTDAAETLRDEVTVMLPAAEQRAEAAERIAKTARQAVMAMNAVMDAAEQRALAAEKRAADLMGVLDEVRGALGETWRWGLLGQIPKTTDEQARRAMALADKLKVKTLAALHDEERSAPGETNEG